MGAMLARNFPEGNEEISLAKSLFLWQIVLMHRCLSIIALVAFLLVFRMSGAQLGWMNFSPLPAILLLSIVCLKGNDRWLVPGLAWLISDPLVNQIQGSPLLSWDHLGLVLGVLSMLTMVPWMKRNFSPSKGLVGCLGAAVIFFFVTNTVSFFSLPDLYARSFAGFVQAQWTGPIGLGPTWIFLRNSCAANILFGSIFLLAIRPFSAYFAVLHSARSQG